MTNIADGIKKQMERIAELEKENNHYLADGDTVPAEVVDISIDRNISLIAAYDVVKSELEYQLQEKNQIIWECYQMIGAYVAEEPPTETDAVALMDKCCEAMGCVVDKEAREK